MVETIQIVTKIEIKNSLDFDLKLITFLRCKGNSENWVASSMRLAWFFYSFKSHNVEQLRAMRLYKEAKGGDSLSAGLNFNHLFDKLYVPSQIVCSEQIPRNDILWFYCDFKSIFFKYAIWILIGERFFFLRKHL